jgi:hypothetical protein
MAIPTKLGVNFTPEEVQQMKTAAQTITGIIKSKMEINLTNEERRSLSKVSDERMPYVLKSISTYAVDYPKLNGLAYQHSDAMADMKTFAELFQVLTLVEEAKEVVVEMQMVAGHFAFRFMRDQYNNAQRYRGDNVAGAQIVYDGLKACFEVSTDTEPDEA